MKAVIICVDDEISVLKTIKKQLKISLKDDYRIELTESGEEAYELFCKLKEKQIDVPVVISDHIMPGIKGDELLTKVHLLAPNTVNILLTGQANAEAVGNAINNANLYRYISKPWDIKDLIMAVRGALTIYLQQTKIKQQEKQYKEIFENAIEGIFQITPNYHFINANPAMIKMFGYNSFEDLVANIKNFKENFFVNPNKQKNLEKLINNNNIVDFEAEFYRKDETKFLGSISARKTIDENGNINYYEGSIIDITERKQKEKAEKKRKEAESASKLKTQFLANMSHEIRTPMHGILGLTNLALKTDLSGKQQEYLKKIDFSAKHLLGIINDILDLSKIEAGKVEIDINDFFLDEIIKGLSIIFETSILEKKHIKLVTSIADNVPSALTGDSLRLKQILTNLVSNAIKFTKQGEVSVYVAAEELLEDKVKLKFSIKDTGIGLKKEQMEKLFLPFSQADSTTSRKYGGTGLGLNISKQLVEMMNGKIWVNSKPDVGSTIIFTAEFGLQGSKDNNKHSNKDKAKTEFINKPLEEIKGAKILAAEDNKISQFVIIELLENKGCHVTLANNGRQVIDILNSEQKFDALLMDMQMPEMDGYDATKQIRMESKFNNLPIIAVTAHAMVEEKIKCLKAGVNDYLSKPLDEDALDSMLLKWVKPQHNDTFICKKKVLDSTIDFPCAMAGIDMIDGLKRCLQNKKFYKTLLLQFYESYKDAGKKINCFFKNQNKESMLRLSHSINSASGNIGAIKLHEKAFEIETAIKTNDTKNIEILIPLFENLLNTVIESIYKFKSSCDIDTNIPKSDNCYCTLDIENLLPILRTFAKAVKNNNYIKLEYLNTIQSYFKNSAFAQDFDDIGKDIQNLKYAKALFKLEDIDKKLNISLEKEK